MRFTFPSRARKRPPPCLQAARSPSHSDILQTSLLALKESADAFPPLKSAVGGVVSIWDIAERAKHSKAEARDIARRTQVILDVVADAVPDGSAIPTPMVESIERFTLLLDEIQRTLEAVALSRTLSRVCHLKRNEHLLTDMKGRLDDAYRDFMAASTLRLEIKQERTHSTLVVLGEDVRKVSAVANELVPQISIVVFYSRLIVFLA
ncbi:hypothetical protein C8R44DRAFT_988677 [Mycena epipterygia]|nr:hypothetical protein C8R44DRAFT_988677 [Mycena epipterygia]